MLWLMEKKSSKCLYKKGWLAGAVIAVAALFGAVVLFLRPHVICIENNQVQKYISETDYKSGDASVIELYAPRGGEREDRPGAFEIKCPSGCSNMKLSWRNVRGGKAFEKEIEGNPVSIRITNLYPDSVYIYNLTESGGRRVKSGWFITDGTVRMLDIEGIYNVRDIGGHKTGDGKTIRYGKIIRGSEMDGEHGINITENGISEMRDRIGIGFDLDLRDDAIVDLLDDDGLSLVQEEHPKPIAGSALGEDVDYIRIPLRPYLEPWFSLDGQVHRENYEKAFRIIFACVEKDVPLYIHCWGGADRTGTICYLLEGLLGVGEPELAKDYEMTSFAQEFGIRSIDSEKYEYRQMRDYITGCSEGTDSGKDFETFFEQMGFTQTEIEGFREKMLE